jgi:hypothetical protein
MALAFDWEDAAMAVQRAEHHMILSSAPIRIVDCAADGMGMRAAAPLAKTRVWQSTARVIYFPRERQSPGGRQGFEAALLWPPDAKGNSIGL